MQLSASVREKLQLLPDKPGVYIMRDRRGKIIYVGKAASLRNRVRSYFHAATLRRADPKLRSLVHSVADIEFIQTRTEAEATLTEGKLIKEFKPRYNVSFRDDKRFLLIRVDTNEPWPRFDAVRLQKNDGATYFGPYASTQAARAAIDFIDKRLGLRRCSPRIPDEEDHRHCLNEVVRYCSAPCVGKITADAYKERVETACQFLRGDRPELLDELEQEMEAAAAKLDFERAAALRDTLLLLRRAIRERARPSKDLTLQKESAHAGITELAQLLGLRERPQIIEAYDVSTISGTFSVGSLVCAEEGIPDRRRYRMFRIKTVEGQNDPQMLAEVLRRRFTGELRSTLPLPNLVIVDGGLPQLKAARATLDEIGLKDLSTAALAKRFEEIYWLTPDGQPATLRLPVESNALKVLQRIRDEAHRFAVNFHRSLRRKRIQESLLDEIEGIGETRKFALLNHFGSIERLRRASVEEIAAVPKIGPVFAARIYEKLHPQKVG